MEAKQVVDKRREATADRQTDLQIGQQTGTNTDTGTDIDTHTSVFSEACSKSMRAGSCENSNVSESYTQVGETARWGGGGQALLSVEGRCYKAGGRHKT